MAGKYFNWICKPCMIAHALEAKRKRYDRPGFRDFVCEHCGNSFRSAKRHVRHCTIECHIAARHLGEIADRLAEKGKVERFCLRCGEAMNPAMRIDAKFCSAGCNFSAHAQTRKFRRRLGETAVRPRHQPLISLADIAERGAWCCGLCGELVDRERRHPDPLAPSLDHILPLARGGTNDLSNLQISHLRCNLRKRDRID